jgi:hypothetical protein
MARTLSPLQKAYSEFFFDMLNQYEVKSPASLSKEKKSEFFNRIKKEWPVAKRKVQQESREDKVRRIIREEIVSILTEGSQEVKQIEKVRQQTMSGLSPFDMLGGEMNKQDAKLFYSGWDSVEMGFKQMKNALGRHE